MPSGADRGLDELPTDGRGLLGSVKYNMRKSLDLDQEGCYLQPGKKECLEECGFNATAKTIFIIHGWTVRVTGGGPTLCRLHPGVLPQGFAGWNLALECEQTPAPHLRVQAG